MKALIESDMVLWFSKSDGFPEDKSAGVPCKNLQSDYKYQKY